MQSFVKLTYEKPCLMSYLKGIHCFDFWFLQARMNICILPHTSAQVANHKIQVRGMLHDSIGHPHLQFVIVC